MKTYRNLYKKLYSFQNLHEAYQNAVKRKTSSKEVQEFQKHWRFHLCNLLRELKTKTYFPKPLQKFVLRDPKTRVICVSAFRDRVVHHALVNILQPIFEPRFIYDSYASRRGKGMLKALQRFDEFKKKVSKNGKLIPNARNTNEVCGFVLKADIKHYFETVDKELLVQILKRYVKDETVLWLTRIILDNYSSEVHGKGMPLGNWTSQFFANVYLNELDQFVKHELKIKYYIRYVDDFVIFSDSKEELSVCKEKINLFLKKNLELELHPDKCSIIPLRRGVTFLGFRIFYQYKIVRQRNIKKIKKKLAGLLQEYEHSLLNVQDILNVLHGWNGYAKIGNTYQLRKELEKSIKTELSEKEFQKPTLTFLNTPSFSL